MERTLTEHVGGWRCRTPMLSLETRCWVWCPPSRIFNLALRLRGWVATRAFGETWQVGAERAPT
jgi:hypothetical protein